MADERDPRCVFVFESPAAARALAAWLTDKGFPADVFDPGPVVPGDALGLTEAVAGGFEVRVVKPEQAADARAAVADQKEALAAVRAAQERRANRTGTVSAACEECGKASDWPAADLGTTQDCPHCGNYMDVPDPDEDWDGVDFSGGEPEDKVG